MFSLNKAIIVGKLVGILPERQLKTMVIREIEIDTEDEFFDKAQNKRVARTDKVRVTLFGQLVKQIENVPLMSVVMVEGRVRTNLFKSREGKDCESTSVIAIKISHAGAVESVLNKPDTKSNPVTINFDDFNDDIPF
jgi:single-stranded DNA-binding protein